jgi:hypothetical protein
VLGQLFHCLLNRQGHEVCDYRCMTDAIQNGGRVCQHIPGPGIEEAVTELLLTRLTPLAVEAALSVTDRLTAQAACRPACRAPARRGGNLA